MLYYLSVLILTYFVYEVKRNKKGATVAQSVEQLIRNQQVAGSSPASSSNKNASYKRRFFIGATGRRVTAEVPQCLVYFLLFSAAHRR